MCKLPNSVVINFKFLQFISSLFLLCSGKMFETKDIKITSKIICQKLTFFTGANYYLGPVLKNFLRLKLRIFVIS
jgi:hypothetical protein